MENQTQTQVQQTPPVQKQKEYVYCLFSTGVDRSEIFRGAFKTEEAAQKSIPILDGSKDFPGSFRVFYQIRKTEVKS